ASGWHLRAVALPSAAGRRLATGASVGPLTTGARCVHRGGGTLAWTTTEPDRRQRCEPSGTVDTVRRLTDRATGRSRGCGPAPRPLRGLWRRREAGRPGGATAAGRRDDRGPPPARHAGLPPSGRRQDPLGRRQV